MTYSNDINDLLDKVKERKYGKYLLKLDIHKMRGITDQEIKFDFPVTAIIGPNGCGKSTILGSVVCVYTAQNNKSIIPSKFFPKSNVGDTSMQNWGVTGHYLSKTNKDQSERTHTTEFKESNWARRNTPVREILFFGIERTVPASEKTAFNKLRNKKQIKDQQELGTLNKNAATIASAILNKELSKYKKTNIDGTTFLIGEKNDINYSEFHFGAGESSIIRMIEQIESADKNTLVLIEEIENGLHPIVVERLVQRLITIAKEKSIQIIFTTHSDYALSPLPDEAIWSCINQKLQQGKLSVDSLLALSGYIEKKLIIYVEDEFARLLVERILSDVPELKRQLEIHQAGGADSAIKFHKNIKLNPATKNKVKSLCILDGDQEKSIDKENGIITLKGNAPEEEIFNAALNLTDEELKSLMKYCNLGENYPMQSFRESINTIKNISRDHHLVFKELSEQTGQRTETLSIGFISFWKDKNQDFCQSIIGEVERILNT
ncbi:ATP-dependent nuclease [Lonepinella sp. BR2271]|uniref:ATP-dependent nuclease n=1 Tax=Lonepinella sp. BR2271 TaxID=3434550 RepID=UPI003F6DBB2C